MTNHERVEVMIEKFLEHCNLWEPTDPSMHLERAYVIDSKATVTVDRWTGVRIVSVYCMVDDELGYFSMVGMWDLEDDYLQYLTALVDTDWAEVGKATWPTGFITDDNPWRRTWTFTNTPTT